MHYIALTGSGILMVGCILPWASSGANSLDILLSGLALLGGLSAFGVAVYNIANGHERLKGAYPIIGARIKTSLHVISGAFMGQVIPIPEEGIVFGRDPSRCNLILQSSDISRMHARLTPSMTGSGAILEDLSSTNGTFLWEEGAWTRLSVPVNIVARGRFRLGDEKNEFEIC